MHVFAVEVIYHPCTGLAFDCLLVVEVVDRGKRGSPICTWQQLADMV